MLYLAFTPSMLTQQRLRDLAEAHNLLDPYSSLPQPFQGELRRHALAASIHYSTRIEGNTLTLQQIESMLAGGPVVAPTSQIREAENYREAIAYIQGQVIQGNMTMTEDKIKTIHYLVTKSLPGDYRPGQYRNDQNFVVDRITGRRLFFPPSAADVPNLMRELVEWLNRSDQMPGPYKSALAHLNFVAIHPFFDGNGRTARVIDTFIMYHEGYRAQELVSLESYFGKDTQGYYQAIADSLGTRYAPSHDVTPWVDYYLQAHIEQARAATREMDTMIAEMNAIEQALASSGASESQAIGAWLACRSGQITNRMYQSISGRSQPSATRDLTDLVAKRLLLRVGKGRSSAYIPTEELRSVFNAAAEASQQIT